MNSITLNNGVTMPQLGFGVWQVPDDESAKAVATAIEYGYRSIDTAAIYGNERGVGEAIAASGADDLFVTTKLWNADQGYDSTLRAFDESLNKLKLDVLDLYLIHWPTPARDLYVDTWRAFAKLLEDGRVRAIGVSNFQPAHLERVIDLGVTPAINLGSCDGCTRTCSRPSSARSTSGTASAPRRGARSARAASCSATPWSPSSPRATAARPRRSCCAGTCSSATS